MVGSIYVCNPNVTVCMFGNKNDLKKTNGSITLKEGEKKYNQFKLKFPFLDIHFLGHASCKTDIDQFINDGIQLCLNKAVKCDKCNVIKCIHLKFGGITFKHLDFPKSNKYNNKLLFVLLFFSFFVLLLLNPFKSDR